MADLNVKYGTTNQAITVTLASLANTAFRESTAISNTTNLFLDVLVGGLITTGTSPTVSTNIVIYTYGSVDGGTLYSGNASGTDAAYTGPSAQLKKLGVITVDATSDKGYEFGPFSIAQAFGGVVPADWGLVFKNETGVALNATGGNHDINYQGVEGQSV